MYTHVVIQTNKLQFLTSSQIQMVENVFLNDTSVPVPMNFIAIAVIGDVKSGKVYLNHWQLREFDNLLSLFEMR